MKNLPKLASWALICLTVCLCSTHVISQTLQCSQNIFVGNQPGSCGATVVYSLPTISSSNQALITQSFNATGSIITWTVPAGVYSLQAEARGAEGNGTYGFGGKGAILKGAFNVTPGEQIKILVGSKGKLNEHGAGGGGGSFVVNSMNVPMLVAGGGGGIIESPNVLAGVDANLGPNGRDGNSSESDYPQKYGIGGQNGNGATNPVGEPPSGGNGAGFYSNGAPSSLANIGTNYNYSGKAYVNGGFGGLGSDCSFPRSTGGYGGAGGGDCYGAGGGGGYSGGGGSYHMPGNGGGGGSYNAGSSTSSSVGNIGDGFVIFTYSVSPGTVAQTAGLPSGSYFPLGTTLNRFRITNDAGDVSECSFTITVTDNEAPVLSQQPANITVSPSTIPAIPTITATDNCSSNIQVNFSENRINGSCPDNYTLSRTWTATDQAGNTKSYTQVVIVKDDQAPVISNATGSLDVDLNCNDLPGLNAALSLYPSATDNQPNPVRTLISDETTATCGSSFVRTRKFIFTDACGNQSQEFVQLINVRDLQAPTFTTAAGLLNRTISCENQSALNQALQLVPSGVDNCSAIQLLLEEDYTTSTCGNAYSRIRKWKFRDACGNLSADYIQTISVVDNTPPVITTAAGSLDRRVLSSSNSSITAALALFPAATDQCSTVNLTMVSDYTETVCGNSYNRTRKWIFTDACGNNSPEFTQVIEVRASFATGQQAAEFLEQVIDCANSQGIASAIAQDPSTMAGFSGASSQLVSDQTVAGCGSTYTRTRKWTFIDACGNEGSTFTQVIRVKDLMPPNFTRPQDKTITFSPAGDYNAAPSVTGMVTNKSDNCSATLNPTYTDQVSPCGNNVVITRTWKLADECGNNAPAQIQKITVTDNATQYIIIAKREVKIGEKNFFAGSIGVSSSTGKIEVKKGSVIASPYFVKAANINIDAAATVDVKYNSAASDGPVQQFYSYTGNISGLSNYTVSVSPATILSGNYKDLLIKKGVTVTLDGNSFGKVEIEDGANVTFATPGGIINMESLVLKSSRDNNSSLKFSNSTSLRIKNKGEIQENAQVNINGPKLTVYVGDSSIDEEKFTVKAGAILYGNIYLNYGKLKVLGSDRDTTQMIGWFNLDKLETDKYVNWQPRTCTPATSNNSGQGGIVTVPVVPSASNPTGLQVVPMPNPAKGSFRLKVIKSASAMMRLTVMDSRGAILLVNNSWNSTEQLSFGDAFAPGIYYAEIISGKDKQVLKLIKL